MTDSGLQEEPPVSHPRARRIGPTMAQERNVCAGPFGAVYDFYIERPLRWLGVFSALGP
jgi:hypothetical protein